MEPNTQLGPYRVIERLGAGGMGEVWRAEDPRLEREVAIKVLPAELAADPDRLARLEREARVLASLDHANVAAVFGLEEAGGVRFLVMQLARGVTLEERMAGGALAVDEVVSIALQIACGLEAAHESGVIHRDLKPANVMLDEAGHVKLLDFGLAKPTTGAIGGSSPDLTASPTVLQATGMGTIMGTAAYMSPEQARGRPVDKRTDIWAWGCVAYEMLTGRPLFGGDNVSDILAAVLRQSIDLGALPDAAPPNLRRLIGRALVREPGDRLRDIGDARIALANATAAPEIDIGVATPVRWGLVAGALVLGIVVGAAAIGWLGRPDPPPITRLDFAPPGLQTGALLTPVVSPDGRRVLYRAHDQLWVRDLAQAAGRPIPGTENAQIPFWSPDSGSIAYATQGWLWTHALADGATVQVAPLPELASGGGGVWTTDGRLLVAQGGTDIIGVPARGGSASPTLLADPELGEGHVHRAIELPGGALAYVGHRGEGTADTLAVSDGDQRRTLLTLAGDYLAELAWSPQGALIFARVGPGGTGIWAVGFDTDRLVVTGEPVMLVPGAASPSLSADGSLLLYDPEPAPAVALTVRGRLALVASLSSNDVDEVNVLMDYENLLGRSGNRLSPDGTRAAFVVQEGGGSNIWLLDLTNRTRRRLTDDDAFERAPAWSVDGRSIYFTRNDTDIARVDVASGAVEIFGPGRDPAVVPGSDRLLVLRRGEGQAAGEELWLMDADAGAEAEAFRGGGFAYERAHVSADGRYVAYSILERNRWTLFVEDLESRQRWQVTETSEGRTPRWSPDGNLYFVGPPRSIMRVVVTRAPDGPPAFGPPEHIIELTPSWSTHDFMPVIVDDGIRFLLTQRDEVVGGGYLVAVLGADRLIREAIGR